MLGRLVNPNNPSDPLYADFHPNEIVVSQPGDRLVPTSVPTPIVSRATVTPTISQATAVIPPSTPQENPSGPVLLSGALWALLGGFVGKYAFGKSFLGSGAVVGGAAVAAAFAAPDQARRFVLLPLGIVSTTFWGAFLGFPEAIRQ